MKSDTFNVQQLFQERRQYRVPFYQRPYVWNREDQWSRLWEDIRDKAEGRLSDGKQVPHFMGAVVLEPQKKAGLLGVERHHIIDGQQRLTTLQYVLKGLCHVLRERRQHESLISLVASCLENPNPQTMEEATVERFKVWPTFRDRHQYEAAVTAVDLHELRQRFPESFTQSGTLRKVGIDHPPALEAISFFSSCMSDWLGEAADADLSRYANALSSAVLQDLSVVCISLGEDDDAQVIFETLNGQGAKLHATDLIRNFIFMRAGTDADDLYNNLWSQFEAPIWSEIQSRGRLNRPRLEWFVQTAIHADTGVDTDVGRLYASYRRLVDSRPALRDARSQLTLLDRYGGHYLALVTGAGSSPIGEYGRRIAAWDASATHALALKIADSPLAENEKREIFSFIESYLVRRAVCGLSRKNYNKVFAQHLKRVIDEGLSAKQFRVALAALNGDASRWPTDEEFGHNWVEGPMYPGRLDAPKLRFVFHRIETAMRSEKTEERVVLEFDSIDIDHILPQSWYGHWPLMDASVSEEDADTARTKRLLGHELSTTAAAILLREDAVPRFGNLTMVHYGVNRALQNYSFEQKKQAFFDHSHLQLNRVLAGFEHWDEASVAKRGDQLLQVALKLWPGPRNS